jgi:hypothetical protein
MPSLGDIIDELTAHVRTVLSLPAPTTPGHRNLLTSIQAADLSFLESVVAGTVETPCVVIEIGDFEDDTGFGVENDLSRMPVSFHLIARWGPSGNQRTIHASLMTLKRSFDAPTVMFETFERIERGSVRTGTSNPVNEELFVKAKGDLIAGCLDYAPGFQVDNAED